MTDSWHTLRRNVAITGPGESSSLGSSQDMSAAQGSTSTADSTVYLGIGLGVGGAFLLGLIAIVVLTVRKRSEHKRMVEAMEVEEALQTAQRQQVREGPRPVTAAGCSTLAPLQSRAGWGALASDETVNEPEPVARADKRKRSSVSLPKKLKIKQRNIPLKRLKRLTAILESPRSRNSPSLPVLEPMPPAVPADSASSAPATNKSYNLRKANEDDGFVCPGSPKPAVLPSFAIRSPGRYGAGIANNDNVRTYRSMSVGAMPPIPNNALFGSSISFNRPHMHARSLSLGAPPTRPPSGPVPPLSVIKPHAIETQDATRQGICVSRVSSSSHGSSNSSGLVATPILMIPEQDEASKSPSLEELVAQDDSASLQTVTTNKWQNPLITGPRQVTSSPSKARSEKLRNHTSIRGNIARYSAESVVSNRMSSVSAASTASLQDRFSLAQIGLADQISISRVSSENSLQSLGLRKVTTPRKMRRTSVSENGSPAERKRPGILRDISGNSILPSRQLSNATQDSSRSSNGNPFQLDQSLSKPSALKGSPNARKGHRRQNCVRISTLTPQILGPPPSRPTSPSIMQNIEEESGDGDEAAAQPGVRFVSNHRLSRPSSASYSAPNLRLQSYRASLTPSSPTLAVWTAFQEHGLPSQVSDSQLSGSVGTRSGSRQSNCSSMQSIPSFPSPFKTAAPTTQISQPVPEFYLSRPSTDINNDESSSPFEARTASEQDLPSSPPSSMIRRLEYDPAQPTWPVVPILAPTGIEYDPASPAWNGSEPETSSAFFPFAVEGAASPGAGSRSPEDYSADTPPISPKTLPEGFRAFFDEAATASKAPRASEKLTSANASSMMAQTVSKVDFPGAPILSPPSEDQAYAEITPKSTTARDRAVSSAGYLVPMRPPPPPPAVVKDPCVPSPLHVSGKTVLSGPRVQPAQSVLKNAMALRRMNSEVDTTVDRGSRRFVRLGREASPLLPWIGNPNPDASYAAMNELFDFDFASDARSGAEEYEGLDEVDMTDVERKLDGALAGFGVLPNNNSARRHASISVWEKGEEHWQQDRSLTIGLATDRPATSQDTPAKSIFGSPRSIQMTPKSLYDSDGFLRT